MRSSIALPLTALAALSWIALTACGSSSTGDTSAEGPSSSGSPTHSGSGNASGGSGSSGETSGSGGSGGSSDDTSPGDDATTDDGSGDDASGSPHDAGQGDAKTSAPKDGGPHDAGPSTESDAAGGCAGRPSSALVGWASVSGMGVDTTTGGGSAATTVVSSLADLNTAAKDSTARVIEIHGTITGSVTVGSNKTLLGACGAEVHGHIQMTGSVNVIVRDLTVVGNNCTDSPSDCSAGADAISVERDAHHIWFDHDDISDGSDGNLDMTHAADLITVSWTKFHYSGRRTDPAGAAGGHQFSNLIGHSDSNASEDTGHLRITFHHDWWADNAVERMPRVRFGQVHLFDNLYTASGNDYCIGLGVGANIRDEDNVFIGVKNPLDVTDYSNGASILQSTGDIFSMTTGTTQDNGKTAFTPPYSYTPDPASNVEDLVRNGAGTQ